MQQSSALLKNISLCVLCAEKLPNPPKPVVRFDEHSKIMIIGQAPGRKVHNLGIPWMDASGKELRRWLNISEDEFYNTENFALVPMGFCFPGTGKSGDLPPRSECAPHWHAQILKICSQVKLILAVGNYAQRYYLPGMKDLTLTERVRRFRECKDGILPLVHPSPRNKIWHKKNPWFETELLPELRKSVADILQKT